MKPARLALAGVALMVAAVASPGAAANASPGTSTVQDRIDDVVAAK